MTRPPTSLSHQAALRLTADSEPYLSCDECFDQIDAYIETLLDGAGRLAAPLRAHLIGCAACGEEAWSLLSLVATERNRSIDQVRARFEYDLRSPDQPPAWLPPALNGKQTAHPTT